MRGISYGRPARPVVVPALTAKPAPAAAVDMATVGQVLTLFQGLPVLGGFIGGLKQKGVQLVENTAMGLLTVILGAIQGTEAYDRAVTAVAESIQEAIPGDQIVEPHLGRFLADLGAKVGGFEQ